jgi:hypothetical protein
MRLSLSIEPAATKLLHDNPLALLMGMLLDQHIRGCRLSAWSSDSSNGLSSAI